METEQNAERVRGCGGRGPWICDYPQPNAMKAGTRWRCPECGTLYRLTRPRKQRFWRTWYAPDGHWIQTLIDSDGPHDEFCEHRDRPGWKATPWPCNCRERSAHNDGTKEASDG